MSKILQDLKYTKEHEWVRVDGDSVTVGVTDYAQDSMGDVVFIEFPEVGETVEENSSIATIESVKAVSDIYAPLAGTINKVNEVINDTPDIINQDPYGDGWLFKMNNINNDDLKNLLSSSKYESYLASL